jgi:tetratricopeptide (TPR) repeat protein
MRRAVSLFPGDADLLLQAGALHEFLASPSVQDPLGLKHDPGLRSARFGSEQSYLVAAQDFERRAIERNPALGEARVRLGHVLGQLGDHQRALDELKAALAGPTDPRLRYYGWLFTGQELEALGRRDAAREAYRQALSLFPEAQSGAVALAHLERRRGDNAAAVAAVQRVFSTADREAYDPWIDYHSGADGDADQLLDRLRRAIREGRPR